jgi:microcin C transport system ATP-binding protein
MSERLLDARGLRVSFGGKEVVHGVDLHLKPGEKLALVGESGSGKTVTALSLLRLLPSAQVEGQAWLHGPDGTRRDLMALSERELRGIRGEDVAVIFQEPMTALNPLYTVGNQIVEVLQLKKGRPRPGSVRCSCWPTPASPSPSAARAPTRINSRAVSASAR